LTVSNHENHTIIHVAIRDTLHTKMMVGVDLRANKTKAVATNAKTEKIDFAGNSIHI
jgi:hypothetical protein